MSNIFVFKYGKNFRNFQKRKVTQQNVIKPPQKFSPNFFPQKFCKSPRNIKFQKYPKFPENALKNLHKNPIMHNFFQQNLKFRIKDKLNVQYVSTQFIRKNLRKTRVKSPFSPIWAALRIYRPKKL
jgi:exonuclease V gamma subunit